MVSIEKIIKSNPKVNVSKLYNLHKKFIEGLKQTYGLNPIDLDDYYYIGGDFNPYDDTAFRYFKLCKASNPNKFVNFIIPEHKTHCVCGHPIFYNHWLFNNINSNTLVIGSCCMKQFCLNGHRNCGYCGNPHKNRVVNRCNDCRKGLCDTCNEYCFKQQTKCHLHGGKLKKCDNCSNPTIGVTDKYCDRCDFYINGRYCHCKRKIKEYPNNRCESCIFFNIKYCQCGKQIQNKYTKCYKCFSK